MADMAIHMNISGYFFVLFSQYQNHYLYFVNKFWEIHLQNRAFMFIIHIVILVSITRFEMGGDLCV